MEYERKALFGAYRLNEASKTLQVWRSIAPLSRRIIHRLTSRMLIVAVLSARELTVALQYQLTADTVYRATLVRIDSRRTSETRRFSSLFSSFFSRAQSRETGSEISNKSSILHFWRNTTFSTKHFRQCAHANTSVSVDEISDVAGGSRGNSRPSNSYHRVLTEVQISLAKAYIYIYTYTYILYVYTYNNYIYNYVINTYNN